MLSTFAAGLIIVGLTLALKLEEERYEEEKKKFENSDEGTV